MCLEFVYQKDSELDDDKKFKIFISEKKKKKKNNVEKGKFTGGEKYVLSSLDLRLKSEDITMWPDYEK